MNSNIFPLLYILHSSYTPPLFFSHPPKNKIKLMPQNKKISPEIKKISQVSHTVSLESVSIVGSGWTPVAPSVASDH